ncbi:hypothetical protein B296_00052760 [Ensete ventricosum]|uniref:Uncharacterized protein n=1 Tax=Ensete ventricosum TaxID=4639 RepID=A0A426YAW4_ENSVE|nr:hypothetical protein B296_00052760 [Ensete ventricosum]
MVQVFPDHPPAKRPSMKGGVKAPRESPVAVDSSDSSYNSPVDITKQCMHVPSRSPSSAKLDDNLPPACFFISPKAKRLVAAAAHDAAPTAGLVRRRPASTRSKIFRAMAAGLQARLPNSSHLCCDPRSSACTQHPKVQSNLVLQISAACAWGSAFI